MNEFQPKAVSKFHGKKNSHKQTNKLYLQTFMMKKQINQSINSKFDWNQTIPSKDKQSYVIKNLAISPGRYNFLSFCFRLITNDSNIYI